MAIRKIKSEEEIKARQKKMQIVVSIIMASLLLLSTIGYFASEMFAGDQEIRTDKINYAGRTYLKQNELLVLSSENKDFYFFSLPNESRNIYLNESSFADYLNKPLYIINLDPSAQLILMNLEGVYSRWQTACLEECEENLPIKDCSDNLIVFLKDETNRVEKRENCIFIYGDFEKGVDAFSYKLLGIK